MFELIIILTLLALGYFVGSAREKNHYASIVEREKRYQSIAVFETKHIPSDKECAGGELVYGNVVVSIDYFKAFVASLRMLVGGRLRSYESLLDRGRREAVLRMKEHASSIGADSVFNVRFETSSISKGQQDRIGSIEVLVYGSAVK